MSNFTREIQIEIARLEEEARRYNDKIALLRNILGMYPKPNTRHEKVACELKPNEGFVSVDRSHSNYAPKGTLGWPEYTVYLLREINRECRTADITTAAILANPSIDKKKIKDRIRIALWSLKKKEDGDVVAKMVDETNPNAGFIYSIRNEKASEEALF